MFIGRVKKGIYPDHFGLANQMFQIAACLAYAKRNGIFASFPELNDKIRCGPYMSTVFRNLDTAYCDEYNQLISQGKIIRYPDDDFSYRPIPNEYSSQSFLVDGYFQSEMYFDDCKDYIREIFSIDDDTRSRLMDQSGEYVCLHIRRGDYLKFPDVFVDLSKTKYYQEALEKTSIDKVIVITNDRSWCLENMNKLFGSITNKSFQISDGDEVHDLYLMSNSKECIMANSSFSWWGAWLGKKKVVYAPKMWFGGAGPKNHESIYCNDWIIL